MSSTTMSFPKLYLGTMTFGWKQSSAPVTQVVANKMLAMFLTFQKKRGIHRVNIDTARIYANGDTEFMLGNAIESLIEKDVEMLCIGTKAHPSQELGLSEVGIQQQFDTSTKAMRCHTVDEYYLHQPDTNHSLLHSLQTLDKLVKKGKIKRIGLSNYHVSEVKHAFDLCEQYNLTKPSVYQGLYNPLNRLVEKELMPLLKNYNCSFVAYNPLAAGLLTGKHSLTSPIKEGRFKDNENYLSRFYTPVHFEAVSLIQNACQSEGLDMIEATFRWLFFHSCLKREDGILIGASSDTQLEENLGCIHPMVHCDSNLHSLHLSDVLLKAFDDAWDVIQSEGCVFPYWRSFSSDMPGRDSMDSGASYKVSTK